MWQKIQFSVFIALLFFNNPSKGYAQVSPSNYVFILISYIIFALILIIKKSTILFFRFREFPEERNCTDGKYGWKCNDGTCIDADWVCDGENQCPYPDNSDEEIGCNLYTGKKGNALNYAGHSISSTNVVY